jgi:hypothetical protein
MRNLVCGVGFNDGKYPTKKDGKFLLEYDTWKGMLRRCYSKTMKTAHPTYIPCTVSENFKSYSYFYEWCHRQIGFGVSGFEIDKDILKKGNKEYSENTCAFVPFQINSLFTKTKKTRGRLPIGVCRIEKSYRSSCKKNGERVIIGQFKNSLDAFFAYKDFKEAHIKEMAEKWRHEISDEVYDAMMNYCVELTD